MNKHQAKLTVTLSMVFIGTMALASTPSWARAFRDFIVTKSGGTAPAQPKSSAMQKAIAKVHGPGGAREAQ